MRPGPPACRRRSALACSNCSMTQTVDGSLLSKEAFRLRDLRRVQVLQESKTQFWTQENRTQRRKGAESRRISTCHLCGFAPLREPFLEWPPGDRHQSAISSRQEPSHVRGETKTKFWTKDTPWRRLPVVWSPPATAPTPTRWRSASGLGRVVFHPSLLRPLSAGALLPHD